MRALLLWFVLVSVPRLSAATPPAAQLLPTDTLALISVQDWDRATNYWKESPYGRLWQDPAIKAFKENLVEKWKDEFAAPLERELGIKLADYFDLLHGQVSFA